MQRLALGRVGARPIDRRTDACCGTQRAEADPSADIGSDQRHDARPGSWVHRWTSPAKQPVRSIKPFTPFHPSRQRFHPSRRRFRGDDASGRAAPVSFPQTRGGPPAPAAAPCYRRRSPTASRAWLCRVRGAVWGVGAAVGSGRCFVSEKGTVGARRRRMRGGGERAN